MHRPHRSIEVFDISLMAVVTKAMGAFLVMMLLLMPYYSSGPLGLKNTEDLAKAVDEADEKIKEVLDRIAKVDSSPEDLRKLLEETRKLLEEARRLITRLRGEIDALNSQVARLEEKNTELTSRIADLERERETLNTKIAALSSEIESLNKQVQDLKVRNDELVEKLQPNNATITVAVIIDPGCSVEVGLLPRSVPISSDKKSIQYPLNFVSASVGAARSLSHDMGSVSWLQYRRGDLDDTYIFYSLSRDTEAEKMIGELPGYELRRSTEDCKFTAVFSTTGNDQPGSTVLYRPYKLISPQFAYGAVHLEMTFDKGKSLKFNAPSKESISYFNDLIDHAWKRREETPDPDLTK
jgi:peptidoglycan hydrolase CwlO-like protein